MTESSPPDTREAIMIHLTHAMVGVAPPRRRAIAARQVAALTAAGFAIVPRPIRAFYQGCIRDADGAEMPVLCLQYDEGDFESAKALVDFR